MGNWAKAEELYEQGLDAGISKDQETEVVWYRRALMVCPYHYDSLINLGCYHSHRDEYEMAAIYFNRATIADLKNPIGWYNLGVVMHAMGDITIAKKCYEQCLLLDANHEEAHHNLGLI